MILSSRLSLASLIELCRALRHYLSSGLMLRDAFRQQAKTGAAGVPPVAARIASELDQGHNLQHALERESGAFPPIFAALTSVGEATGKLPEVFGDLETYFVRQQALRRQFIASAAWPIIQLVLAVLLIAGVIFVYGGLIPVADIPPKKLSDPPERLDIVGLGLFGASGALTFIGAVIGLCLGLYLLYLLVTRVLGRGATVAGFLLKMPIVGPCLRALALARFCMALRLTMESGMSMREAIALSMRATSNEAFVAQTKVVQTAVRKGDDLSLALTQAGLFPADFLKILMTAETSGRFDDALEHQAQHYNDEAGRRLKVLTFAASMLVGLTVLAIFVWFIFRFFILVYLKIINNLLDGI
jgi:type IV pilus assembly protein PilC